VSASVHDVRTREVPDMHWIVIGMTGAAAAIAAMSSDVTTERIMVCVGSAMILFDILYEREWPAHLTALFYGTMAMMFAIPLMTALGDPFVKASMTVPACFVLFLALFFGGVIKGGADAKCMIVLAMMFPVYPEMFGFPVIGIPDAVSVFVPFAPAVLFHASLFSAIAFIPVIARNAIRGDTKFPNMFIGCRMDAERVENSHVWPMRGCATEDDGKVWAVPQIPFIVPITAAVLFVAFVGNTVFLI